MDNLATLKAERAALVDARDNHNRTHNAGGYGYNPFDAKVEAICAAIFAAEMADIKSRMDVLKPRWNAAVAKYSDKQGRLSMAALKKVEAEAGITLRDIQAVKAMG
jgi:hypothetical protein